MKQSFFLLFQEVSLRCIPAICKMDLGKTAERRKEGHTILCSLDDPKNVSIGIVYRIQIS